MTAANLMLRFSLFLVVILSTACSSVGHKRKSRVGWLEAIDRGSPSMRRVPSSRVARDDSATERNRRGLLQSRSAGRALSSDVSSFENVRLSRWSRLARSIELSWPLREVYITSHFGSRGDDVHEGVDLRAPMGTPVYAAHDGVVLYSGTGISGYGKLVVIKSSAGISTVYGHNSRLLVRKGQRVTRGQKVALSGSSGRSTGPHLHFEVRTGLNPVDPLKLIALRSPGPMRRASPARARSTLAAAERLR